METLTINNPFNAPVYYKNMVTSTMDEARLLKHKKSGTVIVAGAQSAGRGREGRSWQARASQSLLFTLILQYGSLEQILPCLTLRSGLAVSLAIEEYASPLAEKVKVKWPNDIMLLDKSGKGKKAVGILTEAEGGTVYLGIGINVCQREFEPDLSQKAASIAEALGEFNLKDEFTLQPLVLLEKVLIQIHKELYSAGAGSAWLPRLEDRLYLKGQAVCFVPGLPFPDDESADCRPSTLVQGTLQGIGEDGAVLIRMNTGETASFYAGELKI